MKITIDLTQVLIFYLIGCFLALLIALYFQFKHIIAYFREKKKRKVRLYVLTRRDWLSILCSWVVVCFLIVDIIKTKFEYNFCYRRLKDLLKFKSKSHTLHFYCNNKYFHKIKIKIKMKKVLYRLKKQEIFFDDYEYINEIRDELTLENIDEYLDWEEKEMLKIKYEDLVIKRFVKIYK